MIEARIAALVFRELEIMELLAPEMEREQLRKVALRLLQLEAQKVELFQFGQPDLQAVELEIFSAQEDLERWQLRIMEQMKIPRQVGLGWVEYCSG